mmetsp:Transcript_59896/g.122932  ORF Transcript_59896/g.122932 Transcript_59896/m.122932 type:complete len:298 (+) Transcript_59896:793-1686(+)
MHHSEPCVAPSRSLSILARRSVTVSVKRRCSARTAKSLASTAATDSISESLCATRRSFSPRISSSTRCCSWSREWRSAKSADVWLLSRSALSSPADSAGCSASATHVQHASSLLSLSSSSGVRVLASSASADCKSEPLSSRASIAACCLSPSTLSQLALARSSSSLPTPRSSAALSLSSPPLVMELERAKATEDRTSIPSNIATASLAPASSLSRASARLLSSLSTLAVRSSCSSLSLLSSSSLPLPATPCSCSSLASSSARPLCSAIKASALRVTFSTSRVSTAACACSRTVTRST